MEIIIYSNKEIKSIEDLQDIISICYDKPEDRCECKNCYEYIITIDKITTHK